MVKSALWTGDGIVGSVESQPLPEVKPAFGNCDSVKVLAKFFRMSDCILNTDFIRSESSCLKLDLY